jgi:S1-C subfamily serine protease
MFKLFIVVLFLPIGALSLAIRSVESQDSSALPCDVAKYITVKLTTSKGAAGSGVIVSENKGKYTVLTTAHVLGDLKKAFKIQTPDGVQHSASIPKYRSKNSSRISRKNRRRTSNEVKTLGDNDSNDLALIQFVSRNKYRTATVFSRNKTYPSLNSSVYAAGFPAENESTNLSKNPGFFCNSKGGEISFILSKPMKGGYQIGYLLSIRKGMSGGALVNDKGEILGINGRHNHPFVPDYIYKDGTPVEHILSENSLMLMDKSSWAIPTETIETFFKQNSSLIKINVPKTINSSNAKP